MNTLPELVERLKEKDQLEIIDLLHITVEELLERFDDKIEDMFEILSEDLNDEDEED